jgi:hypothetical protein
MGAFLGHFKKKFSSMTFLKKKILPAAHYFLSTVNQNELQNGKSRFDFFWLT